MDQYVITSRITDHLPIRDNKNPDVYSGEKDSKGHSFRSRLKLDLNSKFCASCILVANFKNVDNFVTTFLAIMRSLKVFITTLPL